MGFHPFRMNNLFCAQYRGEVWIFHTLIHPLHECRYSFQFFLNPCNDIHILCFFSRKRTVRQMFSEGGLCKILDVEFSNFYIILNANIRIKRSLHVAFSHHFYAGVEPSYFKPHNHLKNDLKRKLDYVYWSFVPSVMTVESTTGGPKIKLKTLA